ncbi:GRAS transcription factor [Rhynchospora pubera]|uniref:GRAS transcription factor n=1 Tax=Rhynchospora pubera TaxID=906938 RepID=A0AAV8GI09_9POAL|nr:GRAS transcription factor [Rhynchospora pubera]KAJ4804997.1 GRAS transcription factor [Rhynchospora pubera]
MGSSYQQSLYQGKTLQITPKTDPINKLVSDDCPDITLDATLSYLTQILMEEDIREKDVLYTNQSALHAMEKPFYDILGQKYPLIFTNPHLSNHKNSAPSCTDHHLDQHGSTFGTLYASEFNKGVAEGIKFLPKLDKLIIDLEASKLSLPLLQAEEDLVKLNSDPHGDKKGKGFMECGFKGKKKSNVDLDVLEGRNHKILMSYSEESPGNAMFDEVLLNHDNYTEIAKLQEEIQKKASKCSETDQVESADVISLLTRCSHAVFNNDCQSAKDLIDQIKKLSSLDGDGTQRMAYVFADALEARLNGTGREAWRRMEAKRVCIPTSEYLKIAQLYITLCPFPRNSIYYANQTILKVAGKAPKLHIIDFGIWLGFQWPSLIQALSNNNGNTTKLRITGIDFPKPGFRPAELIEETGRRLEAYAERFGVPFEYHGIASNWEDVSIDSLKIERDEILIAHTWDSFRYVRDEYDAFNSPRTRVLNLIRQITPHVFIEGIVSISAFSPFFLTRFRQGLMVYSAIFKILDTLLPRDNKQRQIIERDLIARDIYNVLACEGSDWIVKPETHKQWHQRNLQAEFEQITLDPLILNECRENLKKNYNDNIFFVQEDRNWLIQGWSGRIFHASSTWKPKLA